MTDDVAPTLSQKLVAETIGTFVLVFFGCAAGVASGGNYVAVALAFGLGVLTMAYAVGHVSGGHFNPAVSVSAAITGRMPWSTAGLYSLVQVAAGALAGVLLLAVTGLYGVDDVLPSVSNTWDHGGSTDFLAAFLVELIGTAVFVFVILAVTDRRRDGTGIPAPVVIGLALTLVHLALIGFTGTSVNPARSLGPGLFAGWDILQQQWLFVLAPLTGAAVGGFAYPLLYGYDRPRGAPDGPVAPDAAAAWDPQQQWAGGTPEPSQSPVAEPDPGAQQQWAGGQPEAPRPPAPDDSGAREFGLPGPGPGWPSPPPYAAPPGPETPWTSTPDDEDGRTRIRRPDPS